MDKMKWTKHRADSNTILIKDESSRTVARIIHPLGDDQAEREASLITAAPDMLEALKDIAKGQLQLSTAKAFESYAVNIAMRAIAKAEAL